MSKGKVKGFLKRHSFIVVFIVALIIAAANYMVYPLFISHDLNLVSVPIAKDTILEGSQITEEMLSSVSIAVELLPSGIAIQKDDIIGLFVASNATVPKNGFFYVESLSNEETAMGHAYKKLSEGEFAYTMEVAAVYDQNSILKEGQLVDIYFNCEYEKTDAENPENSVPNAVIFGLLKENARIISVVDSGEARFVTYALSEEDISCFEIARHMAKSYKGEIYPLVYYGSNASLEKTNTFMYDEEGLRVWLKDKAQIFEYPESIKLQKMQQMGLITIKEDIEEVETISDGGGVVN